MSASEPTREQIYAKFEGYNFDNDATFQTGLKSILGNNQGKSEKEQEDAVRNAKFFYFSRFVHNFDYQQYLAWRAAGESSQETQEVKEQQQTTEAAPVQEVLEPSSDANPSYPKSFQEICELIASGKPIPGIRQIPNNLAEGTPSAPKLAPKPKPWERAQAQSQTVASSTEEVSAEASS
ncbi:hypothetical protein CPC16_003701 [Podila verticillata]|uniref:Uncharacterized protein n=1 Tax=Podila verticillata NRRL 6337 TaxID=1069443 RepID=A0A086TIZ6_9FUNG|nr:hypothetical protein BGZ59_002502 [Podila verticillata]KAF9370438.1 hypothetical protein CPC16_003701 [Podila verticillata]KFH61923.1 hypothetical protein MVEG_12257 [Podila verticillata NRRL 6337]